jgi:hypothetical protein
VSGGRRSTDKRSRASKEKGLTGKKGCKSSHSYLGSIKHFSCPPLECVSLLSFLQPLRQSRFLIVTLTASLHEDVWNASRLSLRTASLYSTCSIATNFSPCLSSSHTISKSTLICRPQHFSRTKASFPLLRRVSATVLATHSTALMPHRKGPRTEQRRS